MKEPKEVEVNGKKFHRVHTGNTRHICTACDLYHIDGNGNMACSRISGIACKGGYVYKETK